VPAIFLLKISEGQIGTTNPQFFVAVISNLVILEIVFANAKG
jgi:hypothetical protein